MQKQYLVGGQLYIWGQIWSGIGLGVRTGGQPREPKVLDRYGGPLARQLRYYEK